MNKKNLFDLTKEEFLDFLIENKIPKFRQKQIYDFAIRGLNFQKMHTIPQSLRDLLSENFYATACEILTNVKSEIDETIKFLYRLNDGNIIEGVLMKYRYGYTLCVSTQVGCKMGCAFCASTLNGCLRNLTQAEILGQVIAANSFIDSDEKVGHIVMMGSGEALDNYDNSIAFLKLVHDPEILNIGYRNISLSTCGLVPQIVKFLNEDIPVTLSISLHASNDESRREIMPIAKQYSISELVGVAKLYVKKTGRRVIFEYAAIDGVNTSDDDAKRLAKMFQGLQCHINVIPLNDVKERSLKAPSYNKINKFIKKLEDLGLSVTRRRTIGSDIDGACGQLRNKFISNLEVK